MQTHDQYATQKMLIQRVTNPHDESSWQEFITFYEKYINSIILRMNIAMSDAEDIHQKVLMKLWRSLPTLNTGEIRRFRTYLSAVTKNCVIDFLRQS